jgi:hypothetical protein
LLARDSKNNYVSLKKDKWIKIYEYWRFWIISC